MKYLITGTGRCGTGYIAMVLRSAGVKCGHENVFGQHGIEYARDNSQCWDADSSWLAVPFLNDPILDDVTIVHLVRHPKDVIDSYLSMRFWTDPIYATFVAWPLQYLPDLRRYEAPGEKSAYFYLRWNRRIEPHGDVFHRVEDDVVTLLDKLGISYQGKELFDDKKYNTRRTYPSDVNLHELPDPLRSEILDMGRRYGY